MSSTYIHGTDPGEQDRLSKLNDMTNQPFIDFLQIEEGDRVLEIGAGLGILADQIARQYPQVRITGIEYEEDQLKKAAAQAENLQLKKGDAHQLDFDDQTFDVVYCRYVLEHVKNPEQVLRESKRVLRPGGRLYLQENNILINEFHPACPAYEFVWSQFAALQRMMGGDALIGKKLFSLLTKAEFTSIQLSVQPEVHHYGQPSYRDWIDNIIENIRGAEKKLIDNDLLHEHELREAYQQLQALQENPFGSAYFYWNRASAQKPAAD